MVSIHVYSTLEGVKSATLNRQPALTAIHQILSAKTEHIDTAKLCSSAVTTLLYLIGQLVHKIVKKCSNKVENQGQHAKPRSLGRASRDQRNLYAYIQTLMITSRKTTLERPLGTLASIVYAQLKPGKPCFSEASPPMPREDQQWTSCKRSPAMSPKWCPPEIAPLGHRPR